MIFAQKQKQKNKKTKKQKKQRENQSRDKLGIGPAHTLNPILTIFGMWGGPQDVFLSFEFRVDRSLNFGATGGGSKIAPSH